MSEKEKPEEGTIYAIPYEQAMDMTQRWQELRNPNHHNRHYPKSYTFSSEDFREILKEDRVKFIRIYPGVHEDGSVTLLAVGADGANTDIIQEQSSASGIYDFATPCPSTCGSSPLNHWPIDQE